MTCAGKVIAKTNIYLFLSDFGNLEVLFVPQTICTLSNCTNAAVACRV